MSESAIPKEARRTTLRLNISVLDNIEGIFTTPSMTNLLMNFRSPILNLSVLFINTSEIHRMMSACSIKDITIPRTPKPDNTRI